MHVPKYVYVFMSVYESMHISIRMYNLSGRMFICIYIHMCVCVCVVSIYVSCYSYIANTFIKALKCEMYEMRRFMV